MKKISFANAKRRFIKIFFWIALLVVVVEIVFYVFLFTKEHQTFFYIMLGTAWLTTVLQRRFRKDFERMDKDTVMGYSDVMIMVTIASLAFGFMSIANLLDWHFNLLLGWIISVALSLFLPAYPETEFKKDMKMSR